MISSAKRVLLREKSREPAMTKSSTIVALVLLCGFFGHTNSQENADDVINKVSNLIDPKTLNASGIDLSAINASAIPALNEAKNLFKQKCDKNGGEGTFENAMKAEEKLEECIRSFVNLKQLETEMEKYKPTGDLDVVFRRYCSKTPKLKKCMSNFTDATEPCFEPSERETKKILLNVTDSLLNFVCFKEGDRIALFISANGPECLESKQHEIENCINATYSKYIPSMDANNGSLIGLDLIEHLFVLGNKECGDVSTVQSCIVKELEKCSDPTPANIVDSIFNFILRATPCKNVVPGLNAAATSMISLLLTSSLVLLSLRLV
ncbi:27 kDa hemolymph protein-like [Halictus rubicundus]|uniref:27 kDa hemolymph protein-like n=1 Tax=Halictus rubicundus TaxID=77578 RepID=UPI0040366628